MRKPNIILFFCDDLGIGDVSCFNKGSKINTKNIDRLAKRGMMFTDSHATSALCTPSRYGLLTGRYNFRSRLKSSVIPGDSQTLIEKDRKTLAHLLKENGYKTAAIGKWHLGMDWALKDDKDYEKYGLDREYIEKKEPEYQKGRPYFGNTTGEPFVRGTDIDYTKPINYGPNDYGFDYFLGTNASLDQGPYVLVENNMPLSEPIYVMGNGDISRIDSSNPKAIELGVAAPEHSPYNLPDQLQEKVMEILDDYIKNDDTFFLYYPNHLVHGPIIPQKRFRGKSGIGDYGDFVLQLDSYVGEIIDKLDEAGIFDDTLFIFTSDNGVSSIVGLDELKEKGHDSSMEFRGHKMHIWEGGHREPTIISYPKIIRKGTVSNHMISHSDLYSTIAELLGADISDDAAEDSISNLSLWKGEDKDVREDIVHSSGNGGLSIREGFWKLILTTGGGLDMNYDRNEESFKEVFKPTELYNLKEDISEKNNVIDEYPEIAKKLEEKLKDYILRGRSTPGKSQENQRDLPTGDWEQLAWMDNYKEYVDELNRGHEDEK
ncbi:arylsulfatase [Peptoniphilus sp. MSJ-1]|uniref:Arylsulfatase n=1 Tax=Peptoniphilus ovalis TaxID=2841503 RepID=A0ABS6FE41_9FIRM|nr:arylsulfatase [Peptoniphilus ovalis]MBU5668440.1 arylsulfatase [Peptoniphilus ovalis]